MSELKNETVRILKSNIFHIDKIYPSYDYFPDYVNDRLEEYVKAISDVKFWNEFLKIHYPNNPEMLDTPLSFVSMIEGFTKCLSETITSYYKGKINGAYKSIGEGLEKKILWPTSIIFDEAIVTKNPEELNLYRIRRKEDKAFTKGDMFHIPFEKRGKVSTQRYSIPGHPSLYLGDSIYVCWEELGQPYMREVYGVKVQNTESIKLIEILRVEDFEARIKLLDGPELSTEIMRFVLTYPLTIACSVKTKERGATFKPEYIVPQLFLQYIMENKEGKIDGIKYFSTLIDIDRVENVGIYNYVFPTRTLKEKDFCDDLTKKFSMTEPLFYEHEEISKSNATFYGPGTRKDVLIELNTGKKTPYDWTAFRLMESVLESSPMKSLD